jgi:hypothetical protein
MELDRIFNAYLEEEKQNVINYNDMLVYRYVVIISFFYYTYLPYLYFVWFVAHHN